MVNIYCYVQSLPPHSKFQLIVEVVCTFGRKVPESSDFHSRTAFYFKLHKTNLTEEVKQ